jgi:hypothetical protein
MNFMVLYVLLSNAYNKVRFTHVCVSEGYTLCVRSSWFSRFFKSLFCIVIKLFNRSLEGNFAEEQKFVFDYSKNQAAILLNTIHRSHGTIPLN